MPIVVYIFLSFLIFNFLKTYRILSSVSAKKDHFTKKGIDQRRIEKGVKNYHLIHHSALVYTKAEFTWSTYGRLESYGRLIQKFPGHVFLHFLL